MSGPIKPSSGSQTFQSFCNKDAQITCLHYGPFEQKVAMTQIALYRPIETHVQFKSLIDPLPNFSPLTVALDDGQNAFKLCYEAEHHNEAATT